MRLFGPSNPLGYFVTNKYGLCPYSLGQITLSRTRRMKCASLGQVTRWVTLSRTNTGFARILWDKLFCHELTPFTIHDGKRRHRITNIRRHALKIRHRRRHNRRNIGLIGRIPLISQLKKLIIKIVIDRRRIIYGTLNGTRYRHGACIT